MGAGQLVLHDGRAPGRGGGAPVQGPAGLPGGGPSGRRLTEGPLPSFWGQRVSSEKSCDPHSRGIAGKKTVSFASALRTEPLVSPLRGPPWRPCTPGLHALWEPKRGSSPLPGVLLPPWRQRRQQAPRHGLLTGSSSAG